MDDRLKKALDFSNFMVTLNNQKRVLQETYYQDLILYYKGGQFTATKELICFCQTMLNNKQHTLVLVDDNKIPIEIEDLFLFNNDVCDTYLSASNKFLAEYNKLKKNRNVEKLVEYD